jgi:hypothetical protein
LKVGWVTPEARSWEIELEEEKAEDVAEDAASVNDVGSVEL